MFWRGIAAFRMLFWGGWFVVILLVSTTQDFSPLYKVLGLVCSGGFTLMYARRVFSGDGSSTISSDTPAKSVLHAPSARGVTGVGEPALSGPGWFLDPLRPGEVLARRWWDGRRWTEDLDPADPGATPAGDDALSSLPPPGRGRTVSKPQPQPASAAPAEDGVLAAGWYRDPVPSQTSFRRRWWEGTAWTNTLDPSDGAARPLSIDELGQLPPPYRRPVR